MTFIYDIILNFTNNYYYDFYEWNKKDNLINVKKIPLIRVSKKTLNDFIKYKIKVDKELLKIIYDKSIYLKKDKNKYNYSTIFSNGEKSIGIVFNEDGIVMFKSALFLDEEDDANKLSLKQKEMHIKYKKYEKNYNKMLRSELEKKQIIIKELKMIYNNKEYDRLKYIYYEIFNKTSNEIDVIYKVLINNIDSNLNKYIDSFSNIKE